MLDGITLDILQERFVVGGLFFVRVSAMFASGPFFSNDAFKPQVKVAFGALLAMMMTVAFAKDQPAISFDLVTVVFLALKEIMVGVIIGFSANLMILAARFAGAVIDVEMGFQTGAIFNVNLDQAALIAEIYSLVALMVFLALNGHHALIESVFASVKIIPISAFHLPAATMQLMITMITSMLMIGIKIGAPILIALFITNLALALLSKVAPQINIFVLSYQVKIIVGLGMMLVGIPLVVMVLRVAHDFFQTETMKILMSIANNP